MLCRAIPVIIMTADITDGPMRNIADQGYRVLSKPVRLAKRTLVSHLLRWGRRCLSAQVFAKYKVVYLQALGVLRVQVLGDFVSKLAGVFIPILSDILMTRSGQRYVKKLRRSAQDINEIVTVKTLEAHLLKYARQKLGNIFFAIITLTL